jgi:uncharacterized surface protein with fasciclin (FAS1) repeats
MKIKILLLLFGLCIIGSSCKKNYGQFYAAPAGQAGHIYEQIAANPSLSIFKSAIDKVPGLKDILNTSGLYTIMAPNNDAFNKYFASQKYNSIDDVPKDQLSQLIKFHVLKYMLFQVNFLNPGITKLSFGQYKFETQDVMAFNEKINGISKNIYYPGKQMQVYTPYFFTLNSVTLSDYQTVYGADSHISNDTQLNAMGGAVIIKDIAAGNGVIHIVDKVLVPPNNVFQEIDTNPEFADYDALLRKRFLTYAYNKTATLAQGNNGDVNGDGITDSLWNRTFSINPYLDNENALTTDGLNNLISITAFIPTKIAFANYLNTKFLYPNGFGTMDNVPTSTLQLLYNSHFTNSLDWPSKIGVSEASTGGDAFTVSPSDVVNVKMASNGLFYTVNRVFEPAAFKAASGPAFFSPNYSYLANLLNQSGLLSLISSNLGTFTLLGATNAGFANAGVTLSGNTFFKVRTTGPSPTVMTAAEIQKLLGNNILVGSFNTSTLTDGFYPTQSGSFVAIKGGQITGELRNNPTSIINPNISGTNGYFQGTDQIVPDAQRSIFDNVNSSVASAPTTPYKFKELCALAGVLSKDFVAITAVDAGTQYTLFAPSNEAIIAAQSAGVLPKTGAQGTTTLTSAGAARLFNYIKYFFVKKSIFTDGKVTGTFPTSKTDVNFNTIPLTVSYPGNVLTVTSVDGVQAKALVNNLNGYPQNTIAKDGVIQIIDNAFTSQY